MDVTTLIGIGIRTSIFLTVFALGLGATPDDALYLFRRPRQLLRSLLAMNVVMPLAAAAMMGALVLRPAVEIALIALAVSPVPPVLPKKQLEAGGRASYAVGLLVAAAVLAIVFVPVAVAVLGRAFGAAASMPVSTVARIVSTSVLGPLAAGLILRRVAPALATRIQRPVSLVAGVLLVVAVLPILFIAWPAVVSLVGNGTLAAMTVVVAFGILAGHVLGGPDPEDRVVLALATASRHPGMALAIAAANYPQQRLVLPAIVWYLVVAAVVSALYLAWYRRRHAPIALEHDADRATSDRTEPARAGSQERRHRA